MIHMDIPFYMISFDRGGVLYLRGVSVVAGLLWRAAITTGWCGNGRGDNSESRCSYREVVVLVQVADKLLVFGEVYEVAIPLFRGRVGGGC